MSTAPAEEVPSVEEQEGTGCTPEKFTWKTVIRRTKQRKLQSQLEQQFERELGSPKASTEAPRRGLFRTESGPLPPLEEGKEGDAPAADSGQRTEDVGTDSRCSSPVAERLRDDEGSRYRILSEEASGGGDGPSPRGCEADGAPGAAADLPEQDPRDLKPKLIYCMHCRKRPVFLPKKFCNECKHLITS